MWAADVGSRTGGPSSPACAAFLVLGAVVKYAVPGRRLKEAGIPTRRSCWAALLGVVGFFVVPVVGLSSASCWASTSPSCTGSDAPPPGRSTRHALKAVGLSILIELAAGLLAAATWLVGVAVTIR